MKRSATNLVLIGICCLVTLPAAAREEGANASSLGVADAVRSSAVGTSALYFNPAGMHQFRQYAVETGYQYYAPTEAHVFSASIADSATNDFLAAGFGYSYLTGTELTTDLSRKGHQFRGALATGYRSQNITVHAGVGLRYLALEIDGNGTSGLTLDAGALFTINGMFRFAVVGHNLIETELGEAPRLLGLGTSLLFRNLIVSFDSVLDLDTSDEVKPQFDVGIEYAIGGVVPLRAGYQHDDILGRKYVSGGLGYVSRVVAADFGFRQNIERKNDNIFSFNVRVFIP